MNLCVEVGQDFRRFLLKHRISENAEMRKYKSSKIFAYRPTKTRLFIDLSPAINSKTLSYS